MNDPIKMTVSNPMELNYDPKLKVLILTYDDTSVGHRRYELRFDPQATRALFDVLIQASTLLGGLIGAEVIEQKQLQ